LIGVLKIFDGCPGDILMAVLDMYEVFSWHIWRFFFRSDWFPFHRWCVSLHIRWVSL